MSRLHLQQNADNSMIEARSSSKAALKESKKDFQDGNITNFYV